MRKALYCFWVLCFIFLSTQQAFGYLGKSIRIMGFGDELAGVIQDEYTDIYRNPAYLCFVERVKVFGQYNLYGHSELKIAEDFRNEEAGLAGLVLPLTKYGNLALIGELKPSTEEDRYATASNTYYTIDTSSVKWFSKKSIRNFKVIYSTKLSPALSVGIDFAYLKNYNDADTNKTITTQSYNDYGELWEYTQGVIINNYNNSPDAQRGSIGIILTPDQRTNLDFTLYYENLVYTSASSSKEEVETKWFRSDTSFRENLSYRTGATPIRNRAVGVDANFKYHFPQSTSLTILLGSRYQMNETSFTQQNKDSTYYSWHWTELSNEEIFRRINDKLYNFIMGIGVEKDFSSSIKVGAAFRGYWDRRRIKRYERQDTNSVSTYHDSVTNSSSSFWENRINKITNSYKLSFPIGAEIALHKMIKARFGGGFIVRREETETGYSTHTEDYYSQGFGLSYNERIFLDVIFKDELTPVGNWMAKVEYRF
jgi:hypothetical protein